MADISQWDFFNRNVQSGLLEGRYMNAAFTLIAAGPPRLSAVLAPGSADGGNLTDIAYPIGVVQSINLGVNSQVMRLWEIGSERSYFVRGRTVGQVALGRIMYHGPSLLRVLYAYLENPFAQTGDNKSGQLYDNSASAKLNTSGLPGSKEEFKLAPGYENIWWDLASDVFSQPMGLLIYMRDSNEDTVGAFYLEYCMITNFGWATDAGGTILTENASVLYERMIPIDVQAVALIRNETDMKSVIGGNIVIGSAQ
jgi:hypothetical protein